MQGEGKGKDKEETLDWAEEESLVVTPPTVARTLHDSAPVTRSVTPATISHTGFGNMKRNNNVGAGKQYTPRQGGPVIINVGQQSPTPPGPKVKEIPQAREDAEEHDGLWLPEMEAYNFQYTEASHTIQTFRKFLFALIGMWSLIMASFESVSVGSFVTGLAAAGLKIILGGKAAMLTKGLSVIGFLFGYAATHLYILMIIILFWLVGVSLWAYRVTGSTRLLRDYHRFRVIKCWALPPVKAATSGRPDNATFRM